jgi:transcriptional regulator with XRE-family HTH domain
LFTVGNYIVLEKNDMDSPTDNLYKEIGLRIFRAREKKGLTQEQLGEKIFLQRTSITNIEKGRQKILIHTLVNIALALDVEVSALIPNIQTTETDETSIKYSDEEMEWVRQATSKLDEEEL